MSRISDFHPFAAQLHLPAADSHKGQNGKLLIIGGSQLFHAASKWSLDIASKCVDMVFYASVPENNELIRQAKGEFWNGIVVERTSLESYLQEADVILIGPGMTRGEYSTHIPANSEEVDWQNDTAGITNFLLSQYGEKKWVIDAGALQMVVPSLLKNTHIVTPHAQELEGLRQRANLSQDLGLSEVSEALNGTTILLKGPTDQIATAKELWEVADGHPGMTKGGTGDVLAGLVAGLYTHGPAVAAAVLASKANKLAGEALAARVDSFFNASDLVEELPKVLATLLPEK
jgi:hydroxyethylthiazole kinase-like uncharacterized protein yjeF